MTFKNGLDSVLSTVHVQCKDLVRTSPFSTSKRIAKLTVRVLFVSNVISFV